MTSIKNCNTWSCDRDFFFCRLVLIPLIIMQELTSSVSDIVEGILKMHDTTKVRCEGSRQGCCLDDKIIISFSVLFFFFFWWQLGHLTLEDYQIWSVSSALANEFLTLLFQVGTLHPDTILMLRKSFSWNLYAFVLVQVCHIVLGLRPGTPEEEGQIIRCPVVFLHSVCFWQICIWFNVNFPCVGAG